MLIDKYYQPETIDEAVGYMDAAGRVKALAGGTDLAILLHEQAVDIDAIVDLSRVKQMKNISMQADGLHIGAMATFTQIENNDLVKRHCPMLAKAAASVGSPQVRNAGTIGGNLANAATAADSVPALMALDAQAVIVSTKGQRILPVVEIPTGLNRTCLAPNELIVEFILQPTPDEFMDFEKIGRRKALAISRVNMGIVLQMQGSEIRRASIAFGAIGKTAYRAAPVEALLTGKTLDAALIDAACKQTEEMVVEVLNGRKTTPYKKKIAAAVLRRALENAMRGVQL